MAKGQENFIKQNNILDKKRYYLVKAKHRYYYVDSNGKRNTHKNSVAQELNSLDPVLRCKLDTELCMECDKQDLKTK